MSVPVQFSPAPSFIINGLSAKRFALHCTIECPCLGPDGCSNILEYVSDKLVSLHSDFSATIRIIEKCKVLLVELAFEQFVWLKELGVALGNEVVLGGSTSKAMLTINCLEIYNQTFSFDSTEYDSKIMMAVENGVCTKKHKTTRRTELVPVAFLGVVSDVPTVKIDSEDLLLNVE